MQDTSAAARRIQPASGLVLALALLVGQASCGSCSNAAGSADASPAGAEAARALALLESDATLPARPEVLALAQTLEAAALKEGAGARAVEIHTLAARLFERTWREGGVEEDAKEALRAYDSASKDPRLRGACDAAIASALLAGDFAHDATTTYAELYRTMRRFQSSADGGAGDAGGDGDGCADQASARMKTLIAFKPSERVLQAIDDGLAAEGSLGAAALLDGSLGPSGPPKITHIEQWTGRDASRVVIGLSSQASFRAGDESVAAANNKKTLRTFVDLDGVDLGAAAKETTLTGLVTRISAEPTSTGTRIALDLDGQAYRKVFFLMEPYRVVIDVARHPPGQGSRRQVASVVLDPGHGGNDSGAVGPTGVKEKDVTLSIAKKALVLLEKDGLEVTLTRDDDRFVSLEERTARANQTGGELFVSIHCNAAESRARHGVETYVLDTTKDDIAARVAARENATSEKANAELGSILADMRLADQATKSTKLADLFQKMAMASLRANYDNVLDGGVHYAGFYVLVGARMPAVLFETSYVSNAIEETRLASDDYEQRLADAIANAVEAYRQGR